MIDQEFEKVFEGLPPNGWLTKPEAELLWQEAAKTSGAILEVGCYYGRSTCLLAKLGYKRVVCKSCGVEKGHSFGTGDCGCEVGHKEVYLPGRPVFAVDPFTGFDSDDPDGTLIMRCFADNLKIRGISCHADLPGIHPISKQDGEYRVRLWVQRIEDWVVQPGIGFAYLDGDHTHQGTRNQISKAMEITPRPAIAIHDVNDFGGGVEVRDAALSMLGGWDTRVGRLAVWRPRKKRVRNGIVEL